MGIGFESNKLVDGPAHASLYQTSGKRIDTVHSKFKVAMNVGKWLIPPPQTIAGKHAHHYWIIHSCWSEWWRSERKVKHAHHVKLRFASSFRQLQLISLQSSSHGIRLNVWMNELTWNWRCKPPTKAGSLQFCFFCFFGEEMLLFPDISGTWWHMDQSHPMSQGPHMHFFQSQIAATLPTEPYPMQWQCLGLGAIMLGGSAQARGQLNS